MPSVKAANLGRILRCLPTFSAQIGMALDAELVPPIVVKACGRCGAPCGRWHSQG